MSKNLENQTFIPVNKPLLNGNEKKYLNECIDTGWISSEGPFVKKFESLFSSKVDRNHGIAVSNGSAAIDVALEALDLNSGDEVILPSFTIISCINHIIRVGAVPILIDSDPVTWNMKTQDIEKNITNKTKIITTTGKKTTSLIRNNKSTKKINQSNCVGAQNTVLYSVFNLFQINYITFSYIYHFL